MQSDIWQNDEIIDKHPNYGDTENYFPVVTTQKSINYNSIKVDPVTRDDLFIFEEIMYGKSKLTIQDSNWISDERSTSFFNFVSHRQGLEPLEIYNFEEGKQEHLISAKFLMASNEGNIHSREVTSIILELCRIGGMLKIMTSAGAFIYWWTVEPFKELDLTVKFNRLKNKICQEEKIIDLDQSFDMQYE